MNRSRRKNQTGFTLIEAVIGIGIFAIVIISMGTYLFYRVKQQKDNEAVSNVNQIGNTLRQSAAQYESIRQTQNATLDE